MKPPVEHVRISAKGKEVLIKIKRRTGLEHWNEICRVALCQSLANPTFPPKVDKAGESSIDMEWKTFAGSLNEYLIGVIIYKASKDGIDLSKRDALADYFRSHIERGIMSLQNIKHLQELV